MRRLRISLDAPVALPRPVGVENVGRRPLKTEQQRRQERALRLARLALVGAQRAITDGIRAIDHALSS